MKSFLLSLLFLVSNANQLELSSFMCTKYNFTPPTITPNTCTSFTVSSGTGCAWMCSYCSNTLKTPNFYFTDQVCTWQSGGCVGNPIAEKVYTCCAL